MEGEEGLFAFEYFSLVFFLSFLLYITYLYPSFLFEIFHSSCEPKRVWWMGNSDTECAKENVAFSLSVGSNYVSLLLIHSFFKYVLPSGISFLLQEKKCIGVDRRRKNGRKKEGKDEMEGN